MNDSERFTSDEPRSRQEILELLRKRAEKGFGPAKIVLDQLAEAASGLGMKVDDYVEVGDKSEQIVDQDNS